MTIGKIMIESGKYKAIFDINNENEEGNHEVTINFEPELPKDPKDEDEIFVKNITNFLIWYLKGGK